MDQPGQFIAVFFSNFQRFVFTAILAERIRVGGRMVFPLMHLHLHIDHTTGILAVALPQMNITQIRQRTGFRFLALMKLLRAVQPFPVIVSRAFPVGGIITDFLEKGQASSSRWAIASCLAASRPP
ncbi:MAG: hypothetical protein H6628_04005 [Calditrichae bacterium]|nr:hypothetical protein [Calditrichia bacterium]